MQQVRVYKVNVKENPLRTLVFTDRNIVFVLCTIFTGLSFYLLRDIDFVWRLLVSFTLISFTLVVLSIKIDNQPMYEVLSRMFIYIFRNKNERF